MRSLKRFVLPLVLVAVGILWIFIGVDTYRKHRDFPQTTAVITDIQVEYNADNDTEHHVFVQYTVDGKSYESELGQYVSGYKAGKEVEISYNPDDPVDIQPGGIGNSLYMLIGGPVIILIGLFTLIRKLLLGK